jgi:NAD+ synthase
MSMLYYYAAVMNRFVLGTGNKSELKLGYFTKYGDAAIDLMPLGDLYKTEVRELAEFMQIPMKISRKKSSARLSRGQTTEGEIGLPYEKIDSILMQLENRKGEKEEGLPDHHSEGNAVANADAPGGLNKKIKPAYNRAEVKQILEIIKKNRHKLDPPICRIK